MLNGNVNAINVTQIKSTAPPSPLPTTNSLCSIIYFMLVQTEYQKNTEEYQRIMP